MTRNLASRRQGRTTPLTGTSVLRVELAPTVLTVRKVPIPTGLSRPVERREGPPAAADAAQLPRSSAVKHEPMGLRRSGYPRGNSFEQNNPIGAPRLVIAAESPSVQIAGYVRASTMDRSHTK